MDNPLSFIPELAAWGLIAPGGDSSTGSRAGEPVLLVVLVSKQVDGEFESDAKPSCFKESSLASLSLVDFCMIT